MGISQKLLISGSKHDENKKHLAAEWHGKNTIKVQERPVPIITDPQDVILRVTSTAICGSDLHLYVGAMPGMKSGDVMGHEFMGVVEAVGPEVKTLKKGDRAVASFEMACGSCVYCKASFFSGCDRTNPSEEQESLYGHRSAGFHGYSAMTGGYEGGQAEYARVPLADINALKVPEGISDAKALFLSDILPTAWWATEMGEVGPDDIVAIWGAGPGCSALFSSYVMAAAVGILAAHCCHFKGAKKIIMVDSVPARLEFVKQKVPGCVTINFEEADKDGGIVKAIAQEVEHGPTVAIEAAGFHYAKSLSQKAQMALGLATDPSDMLNEMIQVGVYAGTCNQLNIGAFMEKGLTMRGGQTPVQKFWNHLLELVMSGKLTPDMVITHNLPLSEAAKGYDMFHKKEGNCIKVVLHP
eukprot:jgi/Astpho2/1451/Aster-06299